MKQLGKTVIFCSLLYTLCHAPLCWSATYYVDATNGNDSNSGTSEAVPWKTISKVNSSQFQPGDFILFERGEMWREQLNVSSNGTSKNSITFGAYGNGDKPIISGANVYNNENWTADITNVWTMNSPVGDNTGVLVAIDDIRYLPVPTKDDLTTNKFWIDTTSSPEVIYVYLNYDPDNSVVEVSSRPDCIYLKGSKYITIESLKCQYSNYAGIRMRDTRLDGYCTIRNCETYFNRIFGIVCQAGHEQNTIEGCISHYNGVNLYTMKSNDNAFRNNISHHAIRYIIAPLTDGTGFGNQESNGTIFEGNEVYDNLEANGIEAWNGENLTFDRNYSYNNGHHGISLDYTSGNINITRNVCINNGRGSFQLSSYGILLWLHNSGNIYFYNNTIYNDSEHAHGMLLSSGNIIAKNNLIYLERMDKYCLYIDEVKNLISDYNNFYNSANNNIVQYNGAFSLAAWQEKEEGWDVHSISKNPLFVNVSKNDFRLQHNSPCIDAGTDVGLTKDFDMNIVPQGFKVDIGAFEKKRVSVPTSLSIEPVP